MKKNILNVDLSNVKYVCSFVMRSLFIAIACLFGTVALLLSCYYIDLAVNVKQGVSKTPLFGTYVIVSPSMVPTIKVNDAIVIKRNDKNNYNVGDIITFSSEDVHYKGLTVTHRIVNKTPEYTGNYIYTTKGDNNTVADAALVQQSSIYGKVLFKIPRLGYFQKYISRPSNFFICILIPALAVLMFDMTKIFMTLNKRREA